MKVFGHLKTILTHKHYVFFFARKLGIGWQGFWHDMSKFHPIEFWESVRYYTGTRSPINVCKEKNGYSNAWMHHKYHNKHHYEYWQDNYDMGITHLCMPDKYAVEMLCDYLAAGRTYSGDKFTFASEYDWWKNKLSKPIAMNECQKTFMTLSFKYLATLYGNIPLNKANINWKKDKESIYFFLKQSHKV